MAGDGITRRDTAKDRRILLTLSPFAMLKVVHLFL